MPNVPKSVVNTDSALTGNGGSHAQTKAETVPKPTRDRQRLKRRSRVRQDARLLHRRPPQVGVLVAPSRGRGLKREQLHGRRLDLLVSLSHGAWIETSTELARWATTRLHTLPKLSARFGVPAERQHVLAGRATSEIHFAAEAETRI